MTYTNGDVAERINLALKEYQTTAKPSNRICVVPRVNNVVGDDVEGIVHVSLDTDTGIGDYGTLVDCLRRHLGECTFTMDDDIIGKDDGQKTVSITVRKPRIRNTSTESLPKNAVGCRTPAQKKSTGRCWCICIAMLSFLLMAMAAILCIYVAFRDKDSILLHEYVESVLKMLKRRNTSEL